MKYLQTFEARLGDITKTNNIKLNNIINKKFEVDSELTNNVYLNKFNSDLKVIWFHREKHNIIKKIKERTSFKSISEWNIFFEEQMNNLFLHHFDEIHEFGEYSHDKNIKICLYIEEYDIYFAMSIDFKKLFEKPEVFIATLLPQRCDYNKTDLYLNI